MLNKNTISKYKKGLSKIFDGNQTFLAEFDKLIESYNNNMKNQSYGLAFRTWYNNAHAALAGGYLCTPAFHYATVIIAYLTPTNSIEANTIYLANESAQFIGASMAEIIKTINNAATTLDKTYYTKAEPSVRVASSCGGVSSSFRSGC